MAFRGIRNRRQTVWFHAKQTAISKTDHATIRQRGSRESKPLELLNVQNRFRHAKSGIRTRSLGHTRIRIPEGHPNQPIRQTPSHGNYSLPPQRWVTRRLPRRSLEQQHRLWAGLSMPFLLPKTSTRISSTQLELG